MPHTESAKKRLRQTKRRTLANKIVRGSVRTTEKRLRELVEKGDTKAAAGLLPSVYQFLDKAAKNRVLHPNTASNHKAKLARLVARSANKPAAAKATTKAATKASATKGSGAKTPATKTPATKPSPE